MAAKSRDYWSGKACLVTGASSGLGREVAAALAERNAKLAVAARNQEALERAAEESFHGASELLIVAGDMIWQEDVDRLQERIRDQWGRLDLLCNCVGRSSRKAVLDTTPEDFQQLMDANLMSTVRCTRALSEMLLASQGHVVNIGSLASRFGAPYLGAYPASKHALAAYTQQLRMEHGPDGLHAMLACPGPIAGSDVARYEAQAAALPPSAARPGGGAKVRGLDPKWLAATILANCQRRRPEFIAPARVRLLLAITALSPRLGDWFLRRFT